uniref:Uncharacterized protein n=1 Tax=Mus spicilegus TaxID=10103 RepID=A0A8C6I4I4_MUSSI
MVTEQQEEVRVAVEEFCRQSVVWGSTHRVVSTADAQHGYRSLIHIPEWVVEIPVGIPADGATLGVTEQGLLKLSQGATPEELAGVHCVLQGGGIPDHRLMNMPGGVTLVGDTDT